MNIHFVDTFTILLLAVSLVSAQRWSDIFGYHPIDDYVTPKVIEIPQPKYVRLYDDDYTQSLRHLRLFDPFDNPPPVFYVPRVHVAPPPEFYFNDWHPYAHRLDEPPQLIRSWNSVSVTYNTRLVPVIDKDETVENVEDSVGSASEVVPQIVKTKGTTKKDKNGEATGSTGNGKKATPKPDVEAGGKKSDAGEKANGNKVTKPDASEKPNGNKVAKPDADEKADDNKTAEPAAEVDPTKAPESGVADAESEPVEEEAKVVEVTNDETKPKDGDNDDKSEAAATENSEAATVDAEVPAA